MPLLKFWTALAGISKESVFVTIKLIYMNQATMSPQKKYDHLFFLPSLFLSRFQRKVSNIANSFLLT